MKWLDIYDIAIALEDTHPDMDIYGISFPKLAQIVRALEDFEDQNGGCNEKVLEAIQTAWWNERH